MSPREKILGTIVGASAALMALMYFATTLVSGYQRRTAEMQALLTRIDDSELEAQRGLRFADELQQVADESLPPTVSVAKSAYQAWLINLADRHIGLSNASVNSSGGNRPIRLGSNVPAGGSGDGPGSNIAFDVHTFQLNGVGDLEQITDLVFDLQTADINHRISALTIDPQPGTKQFKIILTLEVMAMPTAPARTELQLASREKLAGKTREELKAAILGRNIFGPENNPPELQVNSQYVAYVGQPFSLRLEATDPDPQDKVRFEADLEELGRARFSDSEGTLEWTPRELGEYQVTLAAMDDAFPRGRTERHVTIRVQDPPPREVRVETPRPSLAAAKFVYVSGVTETGGEKQVWLDLRTEGRTLQLGVGDSFQLGSVEAAIAAIDDQQVQIEAGGKRVSVGLGKNLADSGL